MWFGRLYFTQMPPFHKETRLTIRLPDLLKTVRFPLLFCIATGLVSCADIHGAYNYSSESRTPTTEATPTESAGYVGPSCFNNGNNQIHNQNQPSSVGRVVATAPASPACMNQLEINSSERIEFYTDTAGKVNAKTNTGSKAKTYSSQQNARSPIKARYR